MGNFLAACTKLRYFAHGGTKPTMKIHLVFQAPKGAEIGDAVILEPGEAGLIPNVGDFVARGGMLYTITRRIFSFYPDNTAINFDIEPR
jgi:hypothetical protein